MHGKKAIIRSSLVIVSNRLTPPLVCPFYLGKEVYLVVGLPKVVLYVVVLGWYAQLDELLLESARLLEEAVYSSVDFHCRVVVSVRLILFEVAYHLFCLQF